MYLARVGFTALNENNEPANQPNSLREVASRDKALQRFAYVFHWEPASETKSIPVKYSFHFSGNIYLV